MMLATDEPPQVLAWFEFYVRVYDDDVRDARPSRTLLQLLQSAFPALYDEIVARRLALGADEWACVAALLEAFYEVNLGIDRSALRDSMKMDEAVQHAAFVLILEFTVNAIVQSEERSRFVRDIMSMDNSVQAEIMDVLERVMSATANMQSNNESSHSSDANSRTVRDEQQSSPENRVVTMPNASSPVRSNPPSPRDSSVSARSPLHLARNAELERLKRENDILKEEQIHFSAELAELKIKHEQAEAQNANLIRSMEELKIQAEMDLLKKERVVRSLFEERLHAMQRELDQALRELEEKTAVAKEVTELRDEIDLLKPSSERLAKAESTLAKYKTKIEELTSVKEKLRRTEEANADLVEKNLALESQAARTSSLQRKLTESKEANTAIQFRVSELEAQLKKISSELDSKRTACDSAESALAEARALNQQLQLTVDQHLSEKGSTSSTMSESAGGISELNPELMERLARLEHENKTLRSQVDETTSERIDALMDEIDDLTRLKKSFETKYFATFEELKESDTMLKDTEEHVRGLTDDLNSRSCDLESMTKNRDEIEEMLNITSEQLRQAIEQIKFCEAEIEKGSARESVLSSTIAQKSSEISSLQHNLHEREGQLSKANERNDHLHEDVLSHEKERHVALHIRQRLMSELERVSSESEARLLQTSELKTECSNLMTKLDAACRQVAFLKQVEDQYALQSEDYIGRIHLQNEAINAKEELVASLVTKLEELEQTIMSLELANQSSQQEVTLLTDRLNVTTEDLAGVQGQRAELAYHADEVERLAESLKEQLQEARELISMADEDFKQTISRNRERANSLLAEKNRLHEEELIEANLTRDNLLASHKEEKEVLSREMAATIARMTSVIDEKCSLFEEARTEVRALKEAHQRTLEDEQSRHEQEKEMLLQQHCATKAELAEYVALHRFTNEDVATKEQSLHDQLKQLGTSFEEEKSKLLQVKQSLTYQVNRLQEANKDMQNRFVAREGELREKLKAQLDANQRLLEATQGLKSDLAKKDAKVAQLENATTRLESRNILLERERMHYASDGHRSQIGPDSGNHELTEQSVHVARMIEEFELLQGKYKQLQDKVLQCSCGKRSELDDQSGLSTKTYLMERIRQLEHAKSHEEDKKRELLLVNAKLIQDQKQIQVKQATESKEVQALKEKLNTWMLRDERRKKEHEIFIQKLHALEAENNTLRVRLSAPNDPLCSGSQEFLQDGLQSLPPVKSASSDDQENIPPVKTPDTPSVSQKKRKLDEISNGSPELSDVVSDEKKDTNTAEIEPRDSKSPSKTSSAAAAPRATKRRMAHFLSSRMAASSSQQLESDEKPSECQQQ